MLLACGTAPTSTGGEGKASPSATAKTDGPGELAGAVSNATVLEIRGTGGISSPDLPAGTFLGAGGKLGPGQRIDTPRGTRAEIALGNGVKVRVDEDSSLTMPATDANAPIGLVKGELVVLTNRVAGTTIDTGAETVEVTSGDLLVRNRDGKRQYSVLAGSATVTVEGREVPLGPGASLELPTGAKPVDPAVVTPPPEPAAPRPALTLEPLREAAWARSFETAKVIATDVPAGVGSLVARQAGSTVERQSLRLVDQDVQVDISGRVAHTRIEQAFHNDSGTTMEGIYQFPLPGEASISGLQLLVGRTWNEGAMVEKERGRQIFRQIVDATVPRDPALLQWDQGNIFKLNIFPIPGRGERRVRLSYTEILPVVGDSLRYRYPMGSSGATDQEIDRFRFTVRVDGTQIGPEQVARLSTPMATLERDLHGDVLEFSTHLEHFLPTHEFGIDIPVRAEEQRVRGESYRDRDGQRYFMLNLQPNFAISGEGGRRPIDYAVVLDRSHGTTPELWSVGVGLTKAMISGMDERDRVTVLACDSACDEMPAGLSTPANWHEGELDGFVGGQILAGASDVGEMLNSAARALRGNGRDAERVVVYLGDGVPTSGLLTPDGLAALANGELADLRIQAVALGARSDLLMLGALTRASGGDLLRADTRDDLDALAREMAVRAQVPAATEIELELPPELVAVHPRDLSALRPGEGVMLVGKIRGDAAPVVTGEVTLRGRTPTGSFEERFPVALDADDPGRGSTRSHLPRTWAQQEVAYLTATSGFAAHDEIVALSKEYTVMSRYTALLVLENDQMYREFGVRRRAGEKSEWRGELAEAATASTSTPLTDSALESVAETKGGAADMAPMGGSEGSGAASGAAGRGADKKDAEESRQAPSEPSAAPASESERGPAPKPSPAPDPFPGDSQSSRDNEWDRDDSDQPEEEFQGDEGGDANAPLQPAKKSKAPSKAAGKPAMDDDFDAFGGGGGYHGIPYKGRHYPEIRVSAASAASGRELADVAQLRARRDADPSDRAIHRRLVRAAIAAGDPSAERDAAAWAAADPDRVEALTAHADTLAALGDPAALRAYASAVEVQPYSVALHDRLAEAFAGKGDLPRACSHRRALVAIDPARGGYHAELIRCLHRLGDRRAADDAVADGQLRARRDAKQVRAAADALAGAPTTATAGLHGYPELKVIASWSGDADVDIALIDSRGRRLSAMRPEKIRVREERGNETLTLARVDRAIEIEVTRPADAPPLAVTLKVVTPYGSKRFDLHLDGATTRAARVAWK